MACAKLRETLKGEYGEDVLSMLDALGKLVQGASTELGLKDSSYGVTMNLPVVLFHHEESNEKVETKGELKDRIFISDACHWLRFASGAYGVADPNIKDITSVSRRIGLEDIEVLMASLPAKGVMCPGHFIAVDKPRRTIVLGVRGTASISDAITDAVGMPEAMSECPGLTAHQATLKSARVVLEKVRPTLLEAFKRHPGFALVVTGHSLGAGTATLCAIILKSPSGTLPSNPTLKCFAYAPLKVAGDTDHQAIKGVEIHNFVNRSDIVPRLSTSSVYGLCLECMEVDKLNLSFMDRVSLVRKGILNPEMKKQVEEKLNQARANMRKSHHEKFPPLFLPGNVYWLDWYDRTQDQAGDAPPPKVHYADFSQFHLLNLKGGSTILKDHLCISYQEGLESYKKHVTETAAFEADCECSIS